MSGRLAIVADAAAAGIAGFDGALPGGGDARTFAPDAGDAFAAWAPDLVVELSPAGGSGAKRPNTGRNAPHAQVWAAAADDEAAIAPGGDGLRHRMPWPARDDLVDLEPGDGVLVAGGDPPRRRRLVGEIGRHGVPADARDRLDREALAAASVVVLVGDPGAPLPGEAFAALAAGRALVAPRAEPAFGLLPGIDHLAYDDDSQAAQWAAAALAAGPALAEQRAMARLAARRQFASTLYARLLADA